MEELLEYLNASSLQLQTDISKIENTYNEDMKRQSQVFGLSTALVLSMILLTACGSTPSNSMNAKNSMSSMSTTSSKSTTSAGSAARGGGSYLDQVIPAQILNLKLFDQNGKTFTLNSLKGKYVVISNFLTSCQEICPMTTSTMRTIGDAVSRAKAESKVDVIEISVDAGRDSVSRLKGYFDLYSSHTFRVASGSAPSLESLWQYFGAPATRTDYTANEKSALPVDWQTGRPSEYDVSHPDLVLIIGPDSHWKWLDLGNPNPGKAQIPTKLKAFLSEDGRSNLAKPQEPSWTAEAVYSALKDLAGIHLA